MEVCGSGSKPTFPNSHRNTKRGRESVICSRCVVHCCPAASAIRQVICWSNVEFTSDSCPLSHNARRYSIGFLAMEFRITAWCAGGGSRRMVWPSDEPAATSCDRRDLVSVACDDRCLESNVYYSGRRMGCSGSDEPRGLRQQSARF